MREELIQVAISKLTSDVKLTEEVTVTFQS